MTVKGAASGALCFCDGQLLVRAGTPEPAGEEAGGGREVLDSFVVKPQGVRAVALGVDLRCDTRVAALDPGLLRGAGPVTIRAEGPAGPLAIRAAAV
ncbi:MAG: hypothetical protein EOM10_10575, partial [Opitutae bacterium]|nr:hypothetical protein [Opitutae bacterium]